MPLVETLTKNYIINNVPKMQARIKEITSKLIYRWVHNLPHYTE